MNEQLQRLYALHLVDERIYQARQGLAALEQPHPVAQQLQKILTELQRQETLLHKAQTELRGAELDLKSLEEKRAQDNKKLYGGTLVGTRELQALEREIEGLGRSISAGESRVLEAMERIEPVQANVNKLKEYQKAAEAKLAQVTREREQQKKKLQADHAAAEPLREPAAREADPALLREYERIRARRGHPGLAVVANGSCGQCHTSVPTLVMRDLIDGKVIQCDTCSRIYYLPPVNASE